MKKKKPESCSDKPMLIHQTGVYTVGDIVEVTGKVEAAVGWHDTWDKGMDEFIGKSGRVTSESGQGYAVSFHGGVNGYYFPSNSLKLRLAAPTLEQIKTSPQVEILEAEIRGLKSELGYTKEDLRAATAAVNRYEKDLKVMTAKKDDILQAMLILSDEIRRR